MRPTDHLSAEESVPATGTPISDDDNTEEKQWVCCDGCNRWSLIPKLTEDAMGNRWYCDDCQIHTLDREEEVVVEVEDGAAPRAFTSVLDVEASNDAPGFVNGSLVRQCARQMALAQEAAEVGAPEEGPCDDSYPDAVSYVLGDILHAERRPRVKARHEWKKSYSVSLRDAFLCPDPDTLDYN